MKELIVGAEIKVNPAFVAVPPRPVTLISPVVPAPTTAVMLVGLTVVKEVAAVPPKLTPVISVK